MRDEFFWLGAINKASVVINAKENLLDENTARDAARGIAKVLDEATTPESRVKRVIHFEPKLIAAAGAHVTIIHAGRSSQDMHATYRSAMLRDALLTLNKATENVIEEMLNLTDIHRDTVLPAYTNGVAAQPTSFAHYLLGFVGGFSRDRQRMSECYQRLNLCPMGATVLNGTGWPLNRQAMAKRLGFNAPLDNAFDATQIAQTDVPLEVASIASCIAVHVGMIIADIMTQYAQPRPWILLAEGGDNTYVSSAMPQKRNPGLMISVRAEASSLLGDIAGVMARAHNINSGMIDGKLVKKNVGLLNAATTLLENFLKVLKALVINRDRALEELSLDWTASQEIADRLMRQYKLPFRIGHHVASQMVSFARTHAILPLAFPYTEMQRIYREVIESEYPQGDPLLPMSEEEFRLALDPTSILEHRATQGSASPSEISRMINEAQTTLQTFQTHTNAAQSAIETALATLDTDFSAYLN